MDLFIAVFLIIIIVSLVAIQAEIEDLKDNINCINDIRKQYCEIIADKRKEASDE